MAEDNVILLDGAMGTMLQAAGLPLGAMPEVWNITAPEKVTAVQRQYVQAGSRVLYANTFGANRYKAAGSGYAVSDLVAAGVRAARAAGEGHDVKVALDVGPIGQLLEPLGTLTFDEAYDTFKEMVTAGEAAGADLVIFETMSDLAEVRAAVLAARENTSLPVWVTMTFEATGRTFVGTTVPAMGLTLSGLGVDAMGFNCSLGPGELLPLAEELTHWTDAPIILKPNAGLPDPATGKYDTTPEAFAQALVRGLDLGAAAVGGCCGTTPEFIRALDGAVGGRRPAPRRKADRRGVCSATRTAALDGYLLDFDKRFPGTKTVMMMRNYRSTPQILAAANSLIDKNRTRIKKDLIPTLPAGESVLCHHARSAEEEAEWMALQMQALHDGGVPYKDMAVLYRAHYVTRSVEETLIRRKVPYTIYSGVKFFSRMEIKDALCYLRMIVYRDDLSFRRIVNKPRRNMGQRRMKYLEQAAERFGCSLYDALLRTLDEDIFKGTKAARFVGLVEAFSADYAGRPVSEVLSALLNESGYEQALRTEGSQERLDNLAELKQSVYEYETSCGEEATPEHYLAHVALFSNQDAAEPGDRVKLMTVHAAKGLEFPYVFVCGMNEGVFPSRKVRTLPAMEEERRLAFVAMTRAERRLYLTEAEGRNLDGSPRYPSRFVLDIDPALVEHTQPPREGLIEDAREYIEMSARYLPEDVQAEVFAPGDRVEHAHLGPGTVVEADLKKGAHLVQFDSMTTPRSIAFRVKLKKL